MTIFSKQLLQALSKSKVCSLKSMVCCLVSIVCFSGCGYTTASTLPESIKTIHVETFKNSISFTTGRERNVYLPLLEVDVRNAIIDRFLLDGNLKISEPEEADLILIGQLTKYTRAGLRYTDNDDVEEYRVQIAVSLELWSETKQENSWTEPSFWGQATYFLSGPEMSTEESAIEEAIEDLARRIVERTIEDW